MDRQRPCLRRVRALESSGVIGGYTAKVDQEKYGLPINAFISVRLKQPNDAEMRSFEKGIQLLDEVPALLEREAFKCAYKSCLHAANVTCR